MEQVDPSTVTADRIFDAGITTLINGLEHRLNELSHTIDPETRDPSRQPLDP